MFKVITYVIYYMTAIYTYMYCKFTFSPMLSILLPSPKKISTIIKTKRKKIGKKIHTEKEMSLELLDESCDVILAS